MRGGRARDPTTEEIDATGWFLDDLASPLTVKQICDLQEVYAPGKPLRDRVGMNVRVGNYVAPQGGRNIQIKLAQILGRLNKAKPGVYDNPWKQHVEFERLHPFMDGNGRTGRTLWAWHMMRVGLDPFALPFLHRFYYQTLENDGARKRPI
jgi:Fic/DOC family protein